MRKVVFLLAALVVLACNSEEETAPALEIGEEPAEINYSELGNLIASQTQQALGGELKAAMQRGGVAEAVNYCNLKAIPLTDSLAKFYAVSIKRATSKPRNSANAASEAEQEILGVWETKMQNDGEISPVLFEGEGSVDFYSPIVLQALCTNCHGKVGENLTVENDKLIKAKYPNDQATGYAEGDLRGMWHIAFTKK